MSLVNTVTFTDAEGAVREWARAQSDLNSAVNGRVFFGVPDGTPPFPLITVRRIGGTPQEGEAPLDDARISFDVWAKTKAQAAQIAAILISAAHNMTPNTPMGASAVGYGAVCLLNLWSPDPDTDTPRYVIDIQFTLRAA